MQPKRELEETKMAKDYFIEKKKYNFFSRSNFTRGKGRVSGFLVTRMPKNQAPSDQKITHEAPSTSEIRKVKKCTYFIFDDVFFFDKSTFPHTDQGLGTDEL
jgi:hypothetical protein